MLKVLTLALAVFAALAVTNPKQDDHSRALIEDAQKECAGNPLGKLLCGGAATALSAAGIDYQNRIVFSTARLGDSKTIGILGQVFVMR